MSTAVMTQPIRAKSPRFQARIAGVFYLLNILTIFVAIFFLRGLVVSRDPAATASNLLAHESSFRLGFTLELISTMCSIVVAALFYELFRPVSRSLSLLAAFFRLIACAVAVLGYLFQLAPLQALGSAHYLSTLTMEQLEALGLLLYTFSAQASHIVIVFFGFHFVVLGYLIFASSYLPRTLGILAAFAGLGALAFGGLTFLAPTPGGYPFPYFAVLGLLTEVSLSLWLIIAGVNAERWKEQVNAASIPS